MKSALLILLQLAASGSDAYFTERNFRSVTAYEINPIARTFTGTRPGRITYFSAVAAAKITIPIILRKRRHTRMADVFALAGIADNAEGAMYSAAH